MKIKSLLAIVLVLFAPFGTEAKEKKVQQTYENAPYRFVFHAKKPDRGILYGPGFPYGIELKIDVSESHNLWDNVIEIVDSLAVFHGIVNPKR